MDDTKNNQIDPEILAILAQRQKEFEEPTAQDARSIASFASTNNSKGNPELDAIISQRQKEMPDVIVGEPVKINKSEQENISPVTGGLVGSAITGASGLKRAFTAPPEIGQQISQDLEAGSAAAKTAGEKWAAKTGYGAGEGTVRDVSQRFQKMMPKGKLARSYAETLGGTQAMRDAAAKLAAQSSAEAKLANTFVNKVGKPIGQFLETPIKKALSGFGTGFGALDAYNRYQQGDEEGAIAAATGALASLAQPYFANPESIMGRTALGRAVGSTLGPLGFGIPAYLTGRDVYRNSYLPVSSTYPEAGHPSPQAILAKQYPDNTGNPMAQP